MSHPRGATGPLEPTPPFGERSSQTSRRAASLFNLASHPARLAILLALADGERDARQLAESLRQRDAASIRPLLSTLREGDLIQSRHRGRKSVYVLTERGAWLVHLAAAIRDLTSSPARPDGHPLDDLDE